MDIISHGLWGGIAFGRNTKKSFLWAIFLGMLPDLSSFGIFTVATFLGIHERPDWSSGPPPMEMIPDYIHTLYNISHSLITFIVIFSLIWFIRKKPFWPFAAYGLAVAYDIPTHSINFFATPFLWPISNFKFDGTPWSYPPIFFGNFIALTITYAIWLIWKRGNLFTKK